MNNSRSLIEHYKIIWLDSNIHHAEVNTKNSFDNIRNLIDSINIFINLDECIHFLDTIKNAQIFLIITASFDQQQIRLINLIEETIQIDSVYIFSSDLSKVNHWKIDCRKLKGIFSQIDHICDALERIICPLETDTSLTTIVSTIDKNLDEFDQSFIYSKVLTELIHKVNYDEQAKKDSFDFCRGYYADNESKLDEINEFEENYEHHSPIWWYTKVTPIHELLQDILIKQNYDWMIKMGFFIHELHHEIKRIYFENHQTKPLIVYRGQGMLETDFEKFIQQKDGLYMFHNFISTSTDEETALHFAQGANICFQTIGILFQIEINPLICTIPFACLDNISYYLNRENEILFSTHTIFRIGEMKKIDDRLWKVKLTLSNDNDRQLSFLTDYLRKEIQGVNVWHSLALLFYQMGKYDKAIEIFNRIIETLNNDQEEFMTMVASMDNNIALMHDLMENYPTAIIWYEKALEIQEKSLPSDHPSLAIVYNNIGMAYRSIGNYRRALLYCEKSLDIRLKSSSNQIPLTTNYSNIGMIYESKGDYITALSYYEKAYEIQKSSFSIHHPSLTVSFNNFGQIYSLIGEYSKALSYYEKTLEIQSKFLLPNHPSMAITYGNLGHVYQLIGNYKTSLSYYEEAIEIQKKISSSNQLSLATTYNNIGLVYRLLEDPKTALVYYEETLKIEEKSLSSDHPSLAYTYNNLGVVYQSMGDYSTAFNYYKKTHKIWRSTLSPNHPSLAAIYNNMASVCDTLKEYKRALSNYEKAIEIQQKSPSVNPLELASTYNNIGEVYRSMEDYANALLYYQKTLEIEEKHLSSKHPSFAITLSNMAVALNANNQYQQALDYTQRAFDIFSDALGSNHSQTKTTREFLDQLRQKLTSNS
jgi:tetratricopeptide (TPR) repeat protein